MMKTRLTGKFFGLLALLLIGVNTAHAAFWQAEETSNRLLSDDQSGIQYFIADDSSLRVFLDQVPPESSGQSLEIELPMPDASLARYSITESSIMEAGLAEKFPDIKSYRVWGIDHPGASGRVDISPKGFRALLLTTEGRVLIDPDQYGSTPDRYMSRSSESDSSSSSFQCSTGQLVEPQSVLTTITGNRVAYRSSGFISTFRLAVSATKQYVDAVGANKAAAVAEIITAINRVNAIYERDLSIQLILISGNDQLIDDTGLVNPDFYDSNGDEKSGLLLLDVNQSWVDTSIGSSNYDIGHIFSTGAGGIAQIDAVCSSLGKARGVTGLPNPTGDFFYIDYVSHEIGHQFGAEHSFNGTTGGCFGNRSLSANTFEPGSGSTIMAYAGTCGAENIQLSSDATFHAGSINQIDAYVSSGWGATCRSSLAVSNTDPSANANANAITNFTIPHSTPFQLVGSGIDTDFVGDTLSYQWDQMDAGTATNCLTLGQDLNDNALFRSYEPQVGGSRDFPALGTQLDGIVDASEVMPTTLRSLNFRLTVRDDKSGQATDDIVLTVDNASGPFKITSHTTSTTIPESNLKDTVTWDVANTDQAPITCAAVDIDLLTFSSNHSSYSVNSLIVATPNDGSESITLSGYTNANARYRVKCSNSFFYDISDADLVFTGSAGSYPTTGNSTFFNTEGQAALAIYAGSCTATPPVVISGSGTGGGGSFNFGWILALLGLMLSKGQIIRANPPFRIKSYTQS